MLLQTPVTEEFVCAVCSHCGLDVPAGLIEPGNEQQFCCRGCKSAYQLIRDSGLESFYRFYEPPLQGRARGEPFGSGSFVDYDSQNFQEQFATVNQHGERYISLAVDSIHCAACVWLIEKLPTMIPGVIRADVNWSKRIVCIQWDNDQVALSRVAAALDQLGYPPQPIRENEKPRRRLLESRRRLVQIGIAAAAAGNNMLIAAALYLGMFSSISTDIESLLRVASCLLGLVSFLGPGRTFLQGAVNALRTKTPHMDLPISLGLSVGTLAGTVNTIRGEGEIYFDSLSVLVFLLLVGRWIQFRQQNHAADAVESLYRLTPRQARKIVGGRAQEIPVDELQPDDCIEIRPGDSVPADSLLTVGSSQVDESILTGESRPIEKSVGDFLSAGTKNLSGRIEAIVQQVGSGTRISQIISLVEQAANSKPQIVQWANRIGAAFVIVVIGLAVVTLAVWLWIRPEAAVDRAVALLVVACPCALAMATPLAISVALGRLAQRQILVKAGDALQALAKPGIIWLDKTGTLTRGELSVCRWFGDKRWIPWVAAAESGFNHPIARAFQELVDSSESQPQFIDWQSRAGGIFAATHDHRLLVGNRNLLEAHSIAVSEHWLSIEQAALHEQLSPCWVVVDGEIMALAAMEDQIRPEAAEMIRWIKLRGWEVGILSGDHPEIVEKVSRQLGIHHFRAGVTPEEKLSLIRTSIDDYDTTVMVGDGVNDCAALAAATVGIAVRNSAESSLAAAPVYLASENLASIGQLLRASESTTRTIRTNLAASLSYNAIGVALAMTGWLNPLVAAILMPISSLTVISLSLRAAHRS